MSLTTKELQAISLPPYYQRPNPYALYADGFGSFVTVEAIERASRNLGNLGSSSITGWVAELFGGKPQSWWDRLSRLQDSLVIARNNMATIGKDDWNRIQADLAAMTAQGKEWPFGFTGRFPDYDWLMNESLDAAKRIVATKSHVPTDADLNWAETLLKTMGPATSFAKQYLPQRAAEIAAEEARMREMLGGKLRSPEEAGVEAFKEDIARRARALTDAAGVAFTGLLVVGGIAAVALLIFAIKK